MRVGLHRQTAFRMVNTCSGVFFRGFARLLIFFVWCYRPFDIPHHGS